MLVQFKNRLTHLQNPLEHKCHYNFNICTFHMALTMPKCITSTVKYAIKSCNLHELRRKKLDRTCGIPFHYCMHLWQSLYEYSANNKILLLFRCSTGSRSHISEIPKTTFTIVQKHAIIRIHRSAVRNQSTGLLSYLYCLH